MQQPMIGEWMAIVSLVASASGMGLVALALGWRARTRRRFALAIAGFALVALAIFIPNSPSIIPGLIDNIRYSGWYPFPPTWDHAAAGIALAGLALLAWALWGRRPRGQRCPKCSYDLSDFDPHHPNGACPECGRRIMSSEDWRRRRRRKRVAIASLFMLMLVWPVVRLDEMRERGLVAAIPTPILLLMVYDLSGPPSVLRDETNRRISYEAPAFLRRIGLRREYLGSPDKAREAVVARDKWVVGEPVIVRLDHIEWFRHDGWDSCEVRLWRTGRADDYATRWHIGPNINVSWGPGPRLREDRLLLPAPDAPGSHTIDLRFELRAEGGVIAQHDITLDYEAVDHIDDVLTPVTDPTLDDKLGTYFTVHAFRSQTEVPYFRLYYRELPLGRNRVPGGYGEDVKDVVQDHPGAAFGARFDLMLDDVVVATGWGVWGSWMGWSRDEIEMTPVDEDLFEATPKDDPRLRVRISTDEAAALSEPEATSYWKGEVVLPVRVDGPR